ncbi:MAG TPA: DoxX family protein [Erythrobacter sp.]
MIRAVLRWVLAVFYFAAGVIHILRPAPFLTIMPPGVPFPEAVVLWTGVAEILGAIGLVQPFSPKLRQAAGWGLALYALCVWPANIHHFALDLAKADGGLGLGYHVPRMFAQPVIIWLALWLGECLPPRRRTPAA